VSSGPRKWLILPPLIVGVLLVIVAVRQRQPLEQTPPSEVARLLRVIEVPEVDVVPRVVGYGTAQPAQVWRAVAEVGGRVTWLHPEVAPGGLVGADEAIVHVDSSTYGLAVARLQAEIEATEAQLAELKAQEQNLQASLEIEQASLRLAEADLARTRELHEGNALAERELDLAERGALSQRQAVQSLSSQLNLLPSQRRSLRANLAVKRASLAQAELDLAKTVIRTPFACRLGTLQLEVGQYVRAGEVLFEGSGVEQAEVEAQVVLDRARTLILPQGERPRLTGLDSQALRRLFGIDAEVHLRSGSVEVSWAGRLERIRERLDKEARTVSFVVSVDDPYGVGVPGGRPPLVGGMFCEVELRGRTQPARVVVPRSALRGGRVQVLDAESRLRSRAVEVAYTQADFAVIEAGLEPGETVVVSDPTPAIEGMLVDPEPDPDLLRAIVAQARGEGPLR